MRYIFAVFVPPIGVLMCKRYGHFVVNLIFWLVSIPLLFMGVGVILWAICAIHALSVCKVSSIDKRLDRVVKAIENRNQAQVATTPDAQRPA
jgi:uncharacterized membrane protein YqaE (UPF0057 family)